MTEQEEVYNILALTGQSMIKALEILEKQLNTLYQRAQILLSLAGVVVTVTGFSGRLIAGTSLMAQILVITGLGTVLASAVWVYLRVMGIKWITAEVAEVSQASLELVIHRRNKKTRAYTAGGRILLIGLFFYSTAFALMLLNPRYSPKKS